RLVVLLLRIGFGRSFVLWLGFLVVGFVVQRRSLFRRLGFLCGFRLLLLRLAGENAVILGILRAGLILVTSPCDARSMGIATRGALSRLEGGKATSTHSKIAPCSAAEMKVPRPITLFASTYCALFPWAASVTSVTGMPAALIRASTLATLP